MMKRSISLLIAGFMCIGLSVPDMYASQCVDCHTSPKKLIQITREIAKTRPAKTNKSKGPG